MKKTMIAAGAMALLLTLSGCDTDAASPAATGSAAGETATSGSKTVAATLKAQSSLGTLSQAIDSAGLGTLFDGPASYTLLAPDDAAFAKLGEQGKALMAPDQKAVLVAILRGHLIPGHVTPEAIDKAIADRKGSVTMTTLGDGKITFKKDGDATVVSLADGSTARISGSAVAASNGVIIPLDAVLQPSAGNAAQ